MSYRYRVISVVDWGFIATSEGGCVLTGYVPKSDGGAVEPGVTCATGFDLGQRNIHDLQGLPISLIRKLSPYLGLISTDAEFVLRRLPLMLTQDEGEAVDVFSHTEALNNLLADWDRAGAYKPFEELPIELRTVIADLAFQYGDLPTRTPNFWQQVTTGDIRGAYENLMNFGDAYVTRRRRGAKLIKHLI